MFMGMGSFNVDKNATSLLVSVKHPIDSPLKLSPIASIYFVQVATDCGYCWPEFKKPGLIVTEMEASDVDKN